MFLKNILEGLFKGTVINVLGKGTDMLAKKFDPNSKYEDLILKAFIKFGNENYHFKNIFDKKHS